MAPLDTIEKICILVISLLCIERGIRNLVPACFDILRCMPSTNSDESSRNNQRPAEVTNSILFARSDNAYCHDEVVHQD